jgi:shikimate 5-dehydrogenase
MSYQTKQSPTLYFIGVTTRQSSIMPVFPLWMRELGRPEVVIEGVDLALDDEPVKHDPLSLGALVTSHKLSVYSAAHDLFDELDKYAAACQEVSCISKRDGRLWGHAKDPITASLALDALVEAGHFARTGGEVLCLGAGGAATAMAVAFSVRADRPRRFVAVDRSAARLDAFRAKAAELGGGISFVGHLHEEARSNDALLAGMPAGSLVVNATGMGKDLPGSPITEAAVFPERAVVWELNYRGELEFLRQARAQREARSLTVSDGWIYFLHGWTQIIAEVLHFDLSRPLFERLASIAAEIQ